MKDDGQSRKEAINLMTDPISSKESCRIGTWNVRTMNESTKTAQIVREMPFCKYCCLTYKQVSSLIWKYLFYSSWVKTIKPYLHL